MELERKEQKEREKKEQELKKKFKVRVYLLMNKAIASFLSKTSSYPTIKNEMGLIK